MSEYCLLVPHYNHDAQFINFLPKLMTTNLPCIVIDDGSQEDSLDKVKTAIQEFPQTEVISLGYNRGKGAAVLFGMHYARAKGFTHVIQIDADGQHDAADIEKFVTASRRQPDVFICGRPVFDASAPKARMYGRKVTEFWVALETWSLKIKDGLCGFRVYPLHNVERVLDHSFIGPRMAFDTEILVKAIWLDIELVFVDTKVQYHQQGVSHFCYLKDNFALIRLHTRLMLGMLRYLPQLILRLFR